MVVFYFFDILASQFSYFRIMCDWYLNGGLAFGFATYFGWPILFLEILGRTISSAIIWKVTLSPLTAFSYIILPSLITIALSIPLRRAILFKGRLTSVRVAFILGLICTFGTFIKTVIIQSANAASSVLPLSRFFDGLVIWWAGDLIGFVSLVPITLVLFAPCLDGHFLSTLSKLFRGNNRLLILFVLVSPLIILTQLAIVVPERHFAFWHVLFLVHVFSAWALGFRWTSILVFIVNFGCAYLEYLYPSQTFPLEQQGFLTMLTGGALYLSVLFDEKRVHLFNLEKVVSEISYTMQKEIDFLCMFSHEFRTPLTYILGEADLVHYFSHKPSTEALDKIKAHARYLIRIVDQWSALGNPSKFLNQSTAKTFKLDDLIRRQINKWSFNAKKKALRFEFTNSNIVVKNHEEPLALALDEVIGNAVKFTSKGKIEITTKTIQIKRRERAKLVKIFVKDSGKGIDDVAKIFKAFEQGDIDSTKVSTGTGAGLSFSRAILESIGARIYLEWTTKDVGSSFVIEFEN